MAKRGRPKKVDIETGKVEEKQDKVDKLLEALERERSERQSLEQRLNEIEEKKLMEEDPMSGPGALCEVTKITLSEAWQLKSQEVYNPQSKTEEMKTEAPPEGYVDRPGPNNGHFVVRPENNTNKVHLRDAVFPNCRSKYTQEYSVFGPKPAHQRGDFNVDPPRFNVHLCEKHAKMFDAKDPVKK